MPPTAVLVSNEKHFYGVSGYPDKAHERAVQLCLKEFYRGKVMGNEVVFDAFAVILS